MGRGSAHFLGLSLVLALVASACTNATDGTRECVGTERYAVTLAPAWSDHTTTASPPARAGHAMAFDAARGEVVLFGGEFGSGSSLYNDTWLWDGRAWRLVAATTTSQVPTARRDHAIAFDSARGEMILFGGRDAQGALSDTWAWNGLAWSSRTPTTKPSARSSFGMTYDNARREVLVFGGQGSSAILNDTWVWNGATWAARTPTTKPTARSAPAMAFDGLAQNVVLFGGASGSTSLADTWTWNGTVWSQKSLATSPVARSGASAVFDAARWETLVAFGVSGTTLRADIWAWNGSAWAARTPTNGAVTPAARRGQAIAYDATRREAVVFGGHDGTRYRSDTWIFRAPECSVDADCRDALACTTDTCVSGVCVHDVAPTSCALGGACYAAGVRHPSNPCAACNPSLSRTIWSAEPAGTVCVGGMCDGAGNCRPWSDGGVGLTEAVTHPDDLGATESQPIGAYNDAAERKGVRNLFDTGRARKRFLTPPFLSATPYIATDSVGCHVDSSDRSTASALAAAFLASMTIVLLRRSRRRPRADP